MMHRRSIYQQRLTAIGLFWAGLKKRALDKQLL